MWIMFMQTMTSADTSGQAPAASSATGSSRFGRPASWRRAAMLARAAGSRSLGAPGDLRQGFGEPDGVFARAGGDLQHPCARLEAGAQHVEDRLTVTCGGGRGHPHGGSVVHAGAAPKPVIRSASV